MADRNPPAEAVDQILKGLGRCFALSCDASVRICQRGGALRGERHDVDVLIGRGLRLGCRNDLKESGRSLEVLFGSAGQRQVGGQVPVVGLVRFRREGAVLVADGQGGDGQRGESSRPAFPDGEHLVRQVGVTGVEPDAVTALQRVGVDLPVLELRPLRAGVDEVPDQARSGRGLAAGGLVKAGTLAQDEAVQFVTVGVEGPGQCGVVPVDGLAQVVAQGGQALGEGKGFLVGAKPTHDVGTPVETGSDQVGVLVDTAHLEAAAGRQQSPCPVRLPEQGKLAVRGEGEAVEVGEAPQIPQGVRVAGEPLHGRGLEVGDELPGGCESACERSGISTGRCW